MDFNVRLKMDQQNRMRANMIAGNLQATITIGETWDAIEAHDQEKLIQDWRQILDTSGDIVSRLISSIEHHPSLGPSWKSLSKEIKDSRRYIWGRICLGDLKHHDGTVTKQSRIQANGEQGVAPNP